MEDLLTYLPYFPLIFIGGLILIGAFKGLRRGIARQTVRTITIILSVIISIIAARTVNSYIINTVSGMTSEELMAFLQQYGVNLGETASFLNYLEPSTLSYILAIPLGIIVAPVLFVLCFIVVSAVMLIVHAIVSAILGFKKRRNTAGTRLMGMALGALQGLAVAIIISVPVVGIFSAASDTIAALQEIENQPTLSEEDLGEEESNGAVTSIIDLYNGSLKEYAEAPFVKFAGAMGGKALYKNLSTVVIEGNKYPMVETIAEPVLNIYPNVTALKGFDWSAPSSDQQTAILNIIGAFEDSDYTSNIATDILSSVAKAYNDGAVAIEIPPAMKSMMDVAINALGSVSADTFADTLYTLTDAYFLLADEGILTAIGENPEKAVELLGKKNEDGVSIIGQVTGILSTNAATSEIVNGMAEMSITMLASQLGVEEELVAEVYGKVEAGLYDILAIKRASFATEEAYTEAIASQLDEILKENGMALDADIIDTMAEYIAENHTDDMEINDTHISNIIFSYYDAYVSKMIG